MVERAESIMQRYIVEFEFPNDALLQQGDIVEIAKLWKDCGLMKQIVVSELICENSDVRTELLATMGELRESALKATPCLRALMLETASGKVTKNHDQMIECALLTSSKLKALLEEAAGYISPHLLNLYYVRAQ